MGLLGISVAGGSLALLFSLGGGQPPISWIEDLPLVDSYVVLGLVLGIGFGLGSILTTYGMIRRPRWSWLGGLERVTRHHWSWLATILIGAGQVAWIALEVALWPSCRGCSFFMGRWGWLSCCWQCSRRSRST
ncbi:MAG TPA: hypothetical protein VM848_17085 [Acidimicrobiia bacterium]|nr:hypothetical protein [Acidimicrobiia bacterium]